MPSSGTWRRVALERTYVSEERIAAIIRVKRISELSKLTVTNNWVVLNSPVLVNLIPSSETPVLTRVTRHHISEDGILYMGIMLLVESFDFSSSSQCILVSVIPSCFRFVNMCLRQLILLSRCNPRYSTTSSSGRCTLFIWTVGQVSVRVVNVTWTDWRKTNPRIFVQRCSHKQQSCEGNEHLYRPIRGSGSAVVKALCCKPEGCGFEIRLIEIYQFPGPSGCTRP
jgi:hypothetical protein